MTNAMTVAIRAGDTNALQRLIANDRRLLDRYHDREDNIPILFATLLGKREVVRWLVEAGANVNATAQYGKTALMTFAENADLEMCEVLLTHGAKIGQRNSFGSTAIHFAATNEKASKMVEYLILHGDDVNGRSGDGSSPLGIASGVGNLPVMEMLLHKGADIEAKTKEGAAPIHFAAALGQVEAVEFLIKRGANINARTSRGLTPLRSAEKMDNPKVVEILLKAGAKR